MGLFPPSSKNQNKYLFVIIDELSKWVELIPMRTATANKVAETLENQVFRRFGTPKYILSDNGGQFTSKIMKKMCLQWKIIHQYTSPYHPQSNQSERTNRNLKSMIQAYVQDAHRPWDFHLQKFAFALRTAENETTKVTPALLNLGREIPVPFDRKLQDERENTNEEVLSELRELPQKLQEIIEWVRSNMIAAQDKHKLQYDKTHRNVNFQVGELVLIKNHSLSDKDAGVMQKFNNRWIGPVVLSKKVSEVTYEIQNFHTKKPMGKRHVADMKPYFQRKEDTAVRMNIASQTNREASFSKGKAKFEKYEES
jgi:hypothetical protein